jgi:uncharacterized protein with HEPN domain
MWRDDAYLLDILIAARKVLRYVEDVSWDLFRQDDRTQDAVLRNLQIIGEAARRISEEFQRDHAEIPLGRDPGMRNRLVHEYSRINLDKIWETVRDDIPVLIRQVEPLVPSEEEI